MQASQAHDHILTARTYRDTHECATLASISKETVLETEWVRRRDGGMDPGQTSVYVGVSEPASM